jgi:hypothetical protein
MVACLGNCEVLYRGFSMLVARRDPPFHVDADRASPAHESGYPGAKASGLTRFVTAVQMIGSLLAVPIGIASGYSFYRANFSPETTCQSLRSSIVIMLDKGVDEATRRVLVRRDVEEFEKTCGAVDPDATAAFKTLLAADKSATPVATISTPTEQNPSRADARPKDAVRKSEARPQAVVKQPATAVAPTASEPIRRDPAVSDAQWLDAVRQALVTHKPEARSFDPAKPQTQAPVVKPATQEAVSPVPATAPAPVLSAPVSAVPSAAPTLSPPVSIAPQPSQRVEADHPVPPGSIPDAAPSTDAAKPAEQGQSRIGKWISAIPLLGPVVDNARR